MAHAHVLAAEEQWEDAFAAFEEVIQLYEGVDGRLIRAMDLKNWAKAHLDRGQPEDIASARELYAEALSEFEDMGSPGYVKRIQARLDEIDG